MTSSEIFKKRDFLRDKDERSEAGVCFWHLTRILLKRKDLNHELKIFTKLSKLGDVTNKLAELKRISERGLGAKPRAAVGYAPSRCKIFRNFLKKITILLPFELHFARI